MIEYKELEVGYEFPAVSYELTSAIITKYKDAVEDHSPVTDLVPPLAIAAYTLKAMSQFFQLPPGSIHASQELEFFKEVTIGSYISCRAQVVQKISRGGLNMVVIKLDALDENKERVLSGKATLSLAN